MLMLHLSRFLQRFPFSRTKVRLPDFDFGKIKIKKKADSTHQAQAIANLNQSINQSRRKSFLWLPTMSSEALRNAQAAGLRRRRSSRQSRQSTVFLVRRANPNPPLFFSYPNVSLFVCLFVCMCVCGSPASSKETCPFIKVEIESLSKMKISIQGSGGYLWWIGFMFCFVFQFGFQSPLF